MPTKIRSEMDMVVTLDEAVTYGWSLGLQIDCAQANTSVYMHKG